LQVADSDFAMPQEGMVSKRWFQVADARDYRKQGVDGIVTHVVAGCMGGLAFRGHF